MGSADVALAADQRAREILRIERSQVFQALADTDQFDRETELVGDRHGHAALRGAVELRQGDAGHAGRLAEEPRLLEAVLACRRVDHEQRLVRRALEPPGDHAAHLRELVHQVRLRVQAAGRVDDHDVAAVRLRDVDRFVRDRGGVGAALRADEVGAGAVGPDLELLLSRGAEGVRRADDDRAAVLGQAEGELPDRRRLAGAVDADDEEDGGVRGDVEAARLAEEAGDLVREGRTQILDVAAGFEPLDELRGGANPDVGGDERLLEPLPGRLVAGVEGGRRELFGERAAALAERLAQPSEEPAALLLALRRRAVLAQELRPAPRHAGTLARRAIWSAAGD